MPFDPSARPVPLLPGWLAPGLIDDLATAVEKALARGANLSTAMEEARRMAQAVHPAIAAPDIREALSLALHVMRHPERR